MLSSHFWMFVQEELALVQAAENTTEAWPGIVFGHTDDLRRSLFRQIGKDVSSSKNGAADCKGCRLCGFGLHGLISE